MPRTELRALGSLQLLSSLLCHFTILSAFIQTVIRSKDAVDTRANWWLLIHRWKRQKDEWHVQGYRQLKLQIQGPAEQHWGALMGSTDGHNSARIPSEDRQTPGDLGPDSRVPSEALEDLNPQCWLPQLFSKCLSCSLENWIKSAFFRNSCFLF